MPDLLAKEAEIHALFAQVKHRVLELCPESRMRDLAISSLEKTSKLSKKASLIPEKRPNG